ncbi:MAG TPA: orotate phosphoribosyltransferase [Polyangiaceae bacterium]|nr:orotate phosphoribosyltransferase [Polyangiaceae bacterium]
MAADDRATLLELLATLSYDHTPGAYVLASGKESDEYLDCKMALSHAEALPSLGRLFLSQIEPRVVAVGGLTMGADPIAVSTAQASAGGRNLRWFSARKEPKKHGRRKLIEGDVSSGPVAVVDDVVTTGGSTIDAIRKARADGLDVVQVIVLVDREEEGGLGRIRAEAGPGVPVAAIFKKSEIRAEWERQRALPRTAQSSCG